MQQQIEQTITELAKVVLGKERQLRLSLCCLFSQGHLLIEDLPGMGKTTLSHALAKVLGLAYNRVQFTSDLLPADILGVSIFDRENSVFQFQSGPIFTQLFLADEINRATPKTQSALLEAMAEGQVSIDGETRPLPQPFFVIATQNPSHQRGTYPLPESQLDRFLMRISLGYPSPEAERLLLADEGRQKWSELSQCMSVADLIDIQQSVIKIHCSDELIGYVQRLIEQSRYHSSDSHGLSPRGGLALIRCARAWAFMAGRSHVVPEDVQAVFEAVAEHRVNPDTASILQGKHSSTLLRDVAIFEP